MLFPKMSLTHEPPSQMLAGLDHAEAEAFAAERAAPVLERQSVSRCLSGIRVTSG